jgi:glycine cleavage system H protein
MEENKNKKIRYYEDDKLWFSRKAGVVTVGVTQTCLDETGPVATLSLPDEGDEVDKGDIIVEIEGSEGSVAVYAPCAGFVVEVNRALEETLEPLNEDPDGEGWLFRIEYQDDSDLKEYES